MHPAPTTQQDHTDAVLQAFLDEPGAAARFIQSVKQQLTRDPPAAVPEQRCQRARIEHTATGPLDNDSILSRVFEQVGYGNYVYLAAVCRSWRGAYITLCYKEADEDEQQKLRTHFNPAIATVSTLQWAMDTGLLMSELSADAKAFAHMIVTTSQDPVGVLSLAKIYDLRWSGDLISEAIEAEDLPLLRWLHEHGCPFDVEPTLLRAARQGTVEMLRLLRKATGPWSDDLKKQMLWHAGCARELPAVKWLREKHDAAWPDSFHGKLLVDGVESNDCWPVQVVRWALANGCEWGTWRCQQLAGKRFLCWCAHATCSDSDEVDMAAADNLNHADVEVWYSCDRQQAHVLRLWAHDNGCSCTCVAR
jgi:hypothetical protein